MNKLAYVLKKATPTILIVVSSLGTIGTGVLSAYGEKRYLEIVELEKPETVLEKFKCGARAFWPAGLCCIATIATNVLNGKVNSNLVAGALACAAAGRAQASRYRDEVIEEVGEEREEDIYLRANKKEDRITQTDLIFDKDEENSMKVFRDSISGEFFLSTSERVESGIFYLNKLLNESFYVTENDYRFLLGLKPRKNFDEEGLLHDGGKNGWSVTYFVEYYGMEPWLDHFVKTYKNSKGLEYNEISFAIPPCEEAIEMECRTM